MGYVNLKNGENKFILTTDDCLDVIEEMCGVDFYYEVRDYFEVDLYSPLYELNHMIFELEDYQEGVRVEIDRLGNIIDMFEFEDEEVKEDIDLIMENLVREHNRLKARIRELTEHRVWDMI